MIHLRYKHDFEMLLTITFSFSIGTLQDKGDKWSDSKLQRSKSYRNILNYPTSNGQKSIYDSRDKNRSQDSVLTNVVRFPNSTRSNKNKGLDRLAATVKTYENDGFIDDIEGNRQNMYRDDKESFEEFTQKYPTLTKLLQANNEKRNASYKGIQTFYRL